MQTNKREIAVGAHVLRMAIRKDIPLIMDFIDRHWERGCLLSRDRAYFEYEYVVDDNVNFVIAVHEETGKIGGVQGLIQCSKRLPFDAFGVMWIADPKSGTKFLGMCLTENAPYISGARYCFGVGLYEKTAAALISCMYQDAIVFRLQHYYRLASRDVFKMAVVREKRHVDCKAEEECKLIPIPTMTHLLSWVDLDLIRNPETSVPYKDAWYLEHRYFNHPYYQFNIWGIETSPGKIKGLLIGRAVRARGATALRIVDFWGDCASLPGIGLELDRIMDATGAEYIDFYCSAIPDTYLRRAGFVLRDTKDPNVIPNYFEPFVQENVDVIVSGGDVPLFKGDGDQGRPKRLRLPTEWKKR
jgi:hypothetical protein